MQSAPLVGGTSHYVANLIQKNIDPSRRNLAAVIERTPESKFNLKLLTDNDLVLFEKLLIAMPECWYVHDGLLTWMEDLDSNTIHVVRIAPYGELKYVKEFKVNPDDFVFADPLAGRKFDQLLESSGENKVAL